MKKYVLVATMMVIVVVAAPTPMSAQSADSLVAFLFVCTQLEKSFDIGLGHLTFVI
jgi:hypothetical protein